MKLITHNLYMCRRKGCTTNNYPLKLVANKVELYNEDSLMEYSADLMKRLLDKIDYPSLFKVTREL